MAELGERPLAGPDDDRLPARSRHVAAPRLARHVVELSDGHRVGLAVCGKGLPFVVVHGYSAEGFLYAQTLSRLVGMGFKVIAIDTAGHGSTRRLNRGGRDFGEYTNLLGRALDELGIGPAILAGHSMGGRLVAELGARQPERTLAVLLIDAIVGDTWDTMVDVARVAPLLLAGVGAGLLVDTASTLPVIRDPQQAAKLARLLFPTIWSDLRHPWQLVAPGVSILRSRGSRWMLEGLAQRRVPVVAIHGDRDLVVPLATARSAAERGRGHLITVHGATHSWVLKDPGTLPAIVRELLDGPIGDACDQAIRDVGLDPARATMDAIEAAAYAPNARILELTPPFAFDEIDVPHRRPRYKWTVTDFGGGRVNRPERAGCLRSLLP